MLRHNIKVFFYVNVLRGSVWCLLLVITKSYWSLLVVTMATTSMRCPLTFKKVVVIITRMWFFIILTKSLLQVCVMKIKSQSNDSLSVAAPLLNNQLPMATVNNGHDLSQENQVKGNVIDIWKSNILVHFLFNKFHHLGWHLCCLSEWCQWRKLNLKT